MSNPFSKDNFSWTTITGKIRSLFTIENFKRFLVGRSTTRRIFRIYLLILLIAAILLYLPISFQPFTTEGFGGALHNFRYANNSYFMEFTDTVTNKVTTLEFDFLDSLFMSFSGFTDTGLSLYNINDLYSTFGQVVLMIIIQIGGFGIMFFVFLIWKIFKHSDKVTINQSLLAQSEKGNTKIGNTDKMLITSAILIIIIEIIFGIFYSLWFLYMPAYIQVGVPNPNDLPHLNSVTIDGSQLVHVYGNASSAFFAGFFHSVSVVNNAGFDILGGSSLAPYRNNVHTFFLLVTASQFIVGGIGFPIVYDMISKFNVHCELRKYKSLPWYKINITINRQHRLSLFTKLATWSYFIVAAIGIILSFIFECTLVGAGDNFIWNDLYMFGTDNSSLTYYNKSVNIIFQSLSTRSAGYASFNNNLMNPITKWLNIVLMFIGGSPSSTAGGIRTTTLAIIFITLFSKLKGSHNVVTFQRKIAYNDIINSFIIFLTAIIVIFIGGVILMSSAKYYLNDQTLPLETFTNSIFVCTSAFGTTGLSVGNGAVPLHWTVEVYLMFLMFIGQFGVGSTILALHRRKVRVNLFDHQTETIRLG